MLVNAMPVNNKYRPQTQWLELGSGIFDVVRPASFPKHELRFRNQNWAEKVGLDELTDEEWVQHFGQFQALPENLPQPLALRYHGHQFTHYNPDLGDGRGFLFAQLNDDQGRLLDLGTKGSGQTPYSRQGDGRLTLKGAVREALATHRLEKLGVNTSKTLSVIETGESLERHDEPSPTRAAVLVRLNHSHVRFGTFQRLAFFKEKELMKNLIEYCLTHHYPNITYENFFTEVCRSVATTTAQWMIHGFVHGVLNTDNINITGESFDYGPYRFLPHYDPKFTAAYFDHNGLYAFGRQPHMLVWNLERLKDAMGLVVEDNKYFDAGFEVFKKTFNDKTMELFAQKIGVEYSDTNKEIPNFFYQCLQFLEKSKAPYSPFFHHLYCWHQDLDRPLREYDPIFYDNREIEEIEIAMGQMQRDSQAQEKKHSDVDDLLIDEIEDIWSDIDKSDDWTKFNKKLATN